MGHGLGSPHTARTPVVPGTGAASSTIWRRPRSVPDGASTVRSKYKATTTARRSTATAARPNGAQADSGIQREDVLADDGDHPVGDDSQEHRGRHICGYGPPAGGVGGGEAPCPPKRPRR